MFTEAEEKFIWKILQIACKIKLVQFEFNPNNQQLPLQAKTSLLSIIRAWILCMSHLIHTLVIACHIYFVIIHADLTSVWDIVSILINIAVLTFSAAVISSLTVIRLDRFGIARLYNQILFINRHFGKSVLKAQYIRKNLREKLIIGYIYMSTIGLIIIGTFCPFFHTNIFWYYYNLTPEDRKGILLWCVFAIGEYYFWYYLIIANWFLQLNCIACILNIRFWLDWIWYVKVEYFDVLSQFTVNLNFNLFLPVHITIQSSEMVKPLLESQIEKEFKCTIRPPVLVQCLTIRTVSTYGLLKL